MAPTKRAVNHSQPGTARGRIKRFRGTEADSNAPQLIAQLRGYRPIKLTRIISIEEWCFVEESETG